MIQSKNVQLVHASLEQTPDRHAWFQNFENSRLYLGHATPVVTYKSVESDIQMSMASSPANGFGYWCSLSTRGLYVAILNVVLKKKACYESLFSLAEGTMTH